MKTFEIMDKWLDKIKKNGHHLPSNFNHFVVLKAVNLAIKSDQCMSIAKAIWFIYRNISLFPIALISEFMEHLFATSFIHLFSHWSFTVRQIFHYFIWYVIDFVFFEVRGGIYDTE